jgi:hypothetical protein
VSHAGLNAPDCAQHWTQLDPTMPGTRNACELRYWGSLTIGLCFRSESALQQQLADATDTL